jgi:preprotein translocase subunit SecB
MADNDVNPTGAATEGNGEPVFKIQRVYLKDVSYESPQSPGVFAGSVNWQPQVQLHLNTETTKLEN